MSESSVYFDAHTQTAPDIYACHQRMPLGAAAEGSYYQWRIAVTLAGRCECRTPDETITFTRGWLSVSRPHVRTAWRVCPSVESDLGAGNHRHLEQDWEVIHAVFYPRPHWLPWLEALSYTHGIARSKLNLRAMAEMQKALDDVVDAYNSGWPMRDELAMALLEVALIRMHAHMEQLQLAMDSRVAAATEYIRKHYSEPLTVPDIARAVGLSVPHLSALFSATMRIAPMQYVENTRMARGAELLRYSADSIGGVARATGYSEASYFTHRFRLRYGQTPTVYRAANRPDASQE